MRCTYWIHVDEFDEGYEVPCLDEIGEKIDRGQFK